MPERMHAQLLPPSVPVIQPGTCQQAIKIQANVPVTPVFGKYLRGWINSALGTQSARKHPMDRVGEGYGVYRQANWDVWSALVKA